VRLLSATSFLICGLFIAPCLPLLKTSRRERVVRWVFRTVLRAIGAKIEVRGRAHLELGGRGALVVNNHISWLDIVAVNAVRPMRAQGKKEIRRWPLIGRLATGAGTVYLDRESLRALPSGVAELTGALRAGSLVNVAPEGTTWCGMASGRFRPAMFQAAINAGVPVVPIALRYRLLDGRDTTAPAFIGDETLLTSVRRTARVRGLIVEAHVLPPIESDAAEDRRGLAALAQAAVTTTLAGERESVPQPALPSISHHDETSTTVSVNTTT